MRDIVVYGTGMTAELADYYFRTDVGANVVAFTVDVAYKTSDHWLGRPLVAWENLESAFPPSRCDLFVAVGYVGLNKVRRAKVDEGATRGYVILNYVSSRAITFSTFEAKQNQWILETAIIQPFSVIGRNVTIWPGALIGHHSEICDDVCISGNVVVAGGARIGPRSFVGAHATIRDRITIGADCIIGAASVVLRDLPDGAVVSPGATRVSKVPSHRVRRF